MGINVCCTQNIQGQQKTQLFPVMASFKPAEQPVNIKTQHHLLFDRIRKRLKLKDCLKDPNQQWFQSVKYNIYLYGKLERQRPIGDCFFYCIDESITNAPIIIATNIDQHYVFCNQTLIIYPDDLVYYGSIKNNLATLPRAEGYGMLFSQNFIYEGQFKNGCPHGFGHYRSKTMEYVGDLKNGQPHGQILKKTAQQLFLGHIGDKGVKNGFKITRKNQKVEVADSVQQAERSCVKIRIKG